MGKNVGNGGSALHHVGPSEETVLDFADQTMDLEWVESVPGDSNGFVSTGGD